MLGQLHKVSNLELYMHIQVTFSIGSQNTY